VIDSRWPDARHITAIDAAVVGIGAIVIYTIQQLLTLILLEVLRLGYVHKHAPSQQLLVCEVVKEGSRVE
jgi:hypothetical protein